MLTGGLLEPDFHMNNSALWVELWKKLLGQYCKRGWEGKWVISGSPSPQNYRKYLLLEGGGRDSSQVVFGQGVEPGSKQTASPGAGCPNGTLLSGAMAAGSSQDCM